MCLSPFLFFSYTSNYPFSFDPFSFTLFSALSFYFFKYMVWTWCVGGDLTLKIPDMSIYIVGTGKYLKSLIVDVIMSKIRFFL